MRKKIRAAAAVADGIHPLGRIASDASISKGTLARWIQEPEVAAYVHDRNELSDLWLRERNKQLLLLALNDLKGLLCSPNAPCPAKAWAITMLLQLNGYGDDIADGARRRYLAGLRDDIPRRRRQAMRRHLADA